MLRRSAIVKFGGILVSNARPHPKKILPYWETPLILVESDDTRLDVFRAVT